MYFMTPEQGAVFEEFVAARQADGLDMSLIDGAEVRRLVPPIRAGRPRRELLHRRRADRDLDVVLDALVRARARRARRSARASPSSGLRPRRRSRRRRRDGRRPASPRTRSSSPPGPGARRSSHQQRSTIPIGGERLQIVSTVPQPFWVEPLVYGPNATKQYALFRDLPSWDPALFTTEGEDRDGLVFLPLLVQRASGRGPPRLRDRLSRRSRPEPDARRSRPDRRGLRGGLPGPPQRADHARLGRHPAVHLGPGAGHRRGRCRDSSSGRDMRSATRRVRSPGRVLSQLIAGREPDFDISECRYGRPLDPIAIGAPTHW